jgi:hypothetical protein
MFSTPQGAGYGAGYEAAAAETGKKLLADSLRPAPAYATLPTFTSAALSAPPAPATFNPLSRVQDAALSIGVFSTTVLVAWGIKKGSELLGSIPDLNFEVRA